MNLQEQINRIQSMMDVNESKFFQRRINIDEIRSYLPFFMNDVFHDTKTQEEFKYELVLRVVEYYLDKHYGLGWDELDSVEESEFVNKVVENIDDVLTLYYKNLRRKYTK